MKMIWFFIKFFKEERYADSFISGDLYLNTIDYFRKIECEEDGRSDLTEAISVWLQPADTVIKLNFGGQDMVITKDDLAAPTSISFQQHDYLHLFCLYALHTNGFDFVDNKIELPVEKMEELNKQLKVDKRCLDFGKYAVVIPAQQFINQLRESFKRQPYRCDARLVKYYDNEVFHGEIPSQEVPFMKQKRFSYQQEFRLCVNTNLKNDDAITINIGDLSQISAKVDSAKIINGFLFKND
jgi:hypothetical protein